MKSTKIFNNIGKSVKKLGKGDILGSAFALGTALYGISENSYKTCKEISMNKLQQQAEEIKRKEEQKLHDDAVLRVKSMLYNTNSTIFYSVVKTIFTKDNNMTQYVKFFTFDEMNAEIKNVTIDMYYLTCKMFNVNLKHGDLENTIKLENTDLITIQEVTVEQLGMPVRFKNI